MIVVRLVYVLFAGRYLRERKLPLTSRSLEVTSSPHPVLEQRHEILISSGNLAEVAGFVARQWFADKGFDQQRENPPQILGRGQRRWQRRVNELWDLAWGFAQPKINSRQFRSLLESVEQLSGALRTGNLRLQPE
jgi:hypothetical protein